MKETGKWTELVECWSAWLGTGSPVATTQLEAALSNVQQQRDLGIIPEAQASAITTLFGELQAFLTALEQGVVWIVAPKVSVLFGHARVLWTAVGQPDWSQELHDRIVEQALPLIESDLAGMGIFHPDRAQREQLARQLIAWSLGEEPEIAAAQRIEQTAEWQILADALHNQPSLSDLETTDAASALQSLVDRGFLDKHLAEAWRSWFSRRGSFYRRVHKAGGVGRLDPADMRIWDWEHDYRKSVRSCEEGRTDWSELQPDVERALRAWGVLDGLDRPSQQKLIDLQMKLASSKRLGFFDRS